MVYGIICIILFLKIGAFIVKMLCHGKPLLCGKKAKNSILSDGNESEGEDMYGFLPKKIVPPIAVRRENIYGESPRRRPVRRVTFKDEPPKVQLIQRRHSCAENFRSFAARKYDYQPLIPIENLPLYPNLVGRSSSNYGEHLVDRRPVFASDRGVPPVRLAPPCYHVAVRRAASFSATRGVSRGFTIRRPAQSVGRFADQSTTPITPALNRQFSSSTSDLYADSLVSKCDESQNLSAGSSTSSVSEVTVYRKIGPGDYVSVSSDNKQPQRKSFRSSIESSSDDGVDVSFHSSVSSSTVRVYKK